MIPCCGKCDKEMKAINKGPFTDWIPQCRCKLVKTQKSQKNMMTRNQKIQFKKGKFDFENMAWHARPTFAKIQ